VTQPHVIAIFEKVRLHFIGADEFANSAVRTDNSKDCILDIYAKPSGLFRLGMADEVPRNPDSVPSVAKGPTRAPQSRTSSQKSIWR